MIHGSGAAEFNDSVFRGSIYATAGVFENVEIRNCTGNIRFKVYAGNNYMFYNMGSLSKAADKHTDSFKILASGSMRLSFRWTCTIGDFPVTSYFEVGSSRIATIAVKDGKVFVDGVQSNATTGIKTVDFDVAENIYIKGFAGYAGGLAYSEDSEVAFSDIKFMTEHHPGILKYLT